MTPARAHGGAWLGDRLGGLAQAAEPVRARVDERDSSPGARRWEWIKRGVPLVIELGPRDLDDGVVTITRRDGDLSEREAIPADSLGARIPQLLDEIQAAYLDDARSMLAERTREDIDDLDGLKAYFVEEDSAFVRCGWNGDEAALAPLDELAVSVRCITAEDPGGRRCALTGEEAQHVVVLAKAY